MIRLNMHEAKTHLSKYLDRLAKGETILLCKRNVPVAEIRGIAPARKGKRPIGLAKNRIRVSSSFLRPLPKKVLDAFEGKP